MGVAAGAADETVLGGEGLGFSRIPAQNAAGVEHLENIDLVGYFLDDLTS
jgi:hypothetical protein